MSEDLFNGLAGKLRQGIRMKPKVDFSRSGVTIPSTTVMDILDDEEERDRIEGYLHLWVPNKDRDGGYTGENYYISLTDLKTWFEAVPVVRAIRDGKIYYLDKYQECLMILTPAN